MKYTETQLRSKLAGLLRGMRTIMLMPCVSHELPMSQCPACRAMEFLLTYRQGKLDEETDT